MKSTNTWHLMSAVTACLLFCSPAIASSIGTPVITPMDFDNNSNDGSAGDPFPAGETRVPDFLGGSSTIGFASDVDNERRLALETIPNLFDWAYWDPSGLGDDFADPDGPLVVDNVSGYHDGRQVQWESRFSTPSVDGVQPPNGTISPANLDSLGAQWMLHTDRHVAQSGQGGIRITDSGRVGLRIDPTAAGDIVNGQRFHLDMTIPEGRYVVTTFQEDRSRSGLVSINLPGAAEVVLSTPAAGPDEFAVQFEVLNDSGGPLVLEYELGDLDVNANVTDLDVRFSAAVIQIIPEPTGSALILIGTVALAMTRRRG